MKTSHHLVFEIEDDKNYDELQYESFPTFFVPREGDKVRLLYKDAQYHFIVVGVDWEFKFSNFSRSLGPYTAVCIVRVREVGKRQ